MQHTTAHRPPSVSSALGDRSRGFTLLELLTVMAIIGILAAVAVFSVRKNRSRAAMEEYASNIAYCMKEARTRAVANGRRYAVQITKTSVRWCEQDCPPKQPTTSGIELGRTMPSANGAQAVGFAKIGDIGITAAPAQTALTDITVYFLPNGTVDSDLTTSLYEGFTVYLEHEITKALQYRVAVLPLSGDIRRYPSW